MPQNLPAIANVQQPMVPGKLKPPKPKNARFTINLMTKELTEHKVRPLSAVVSVKSGMTAEPTHMSERRTIVPSPA